jgi:catechol 2,3-dioxygenase-like lactoylglutathione lyase family enzyme
MLAGPEAVQQDNAEERYMDMKLELVLIPVSDPGRAKQFYVEQAGFDLLVDTPTGLPGQRVIQVTPPGSACSIGFGTGGTSAPPGSQQGLHLVATDIVAARAELIGRGVKVGEVQHIADGAWTPGPDPERADYCSFAEFADPDGNLWLIQEVHHDQQPGDGQDAGGRE